MEKETFNFGKALELLKEGKKVCRSGWNGKGMFLTLQEGSSVNGTLMRNKPAKDFYGDNFIVFHSKHCISHLECLKKEVSRKGILFSKIPKFASAKVARNGAPNQVKNISL